MLFIFIRPCIMDNPANIFFNFDHVLFDTHVTNM